MLFFLSFHGMGQWHCYLKLIMPGAKAAVSQIAFVAVDHWRGDPSSFFLLLSAPRASVSLWQRACLFISLRTNLCFCVQGEYERWKGRECVPACVQEWLHVLVAQYDLCASAWEHVCVLVHMQPSLHVLFPQHRLCLCSIHSRLMAYTSCNKFFSFNTISKPHDSPSDILNYLFGLSASQTGKSERHNRTAILLKKKVFCKFCNKITKRDFKHF